MVNFAAFAAFAVAAAETLTITHAVKIEAPTSLDRAYTVQSSRNIETWTDVGFPFLGDGSVHRRFLDLTDPAVFFRLQGNSVSNLNEMLETIRSANNVPAVACVVVRSNLIIAAGAVGVRKWGVESERVTIKDRWHHGSNTKSMTATLAAVLVEQKKVSWETTLADVFPDVAPRMHPQWRTVTLQLLLSHRSGAPGDLSPIWTEVWNFAGSPREGRRFLLEKLVVQAPRFTPGSRSEYSNAGFALAGAMLEAAMNQPWEELIKERLFEPLGMTSAAFGVPATPRLINQPWGHVFANGTPSPIEPGTYADNPPAIGPGATVNCSILDMGRYLLFHLAGEKADTPLLSRASIAKLHADVSGQGYALGWGVTERDWAGGKALFHGGSNTQWYSNMWLAPGKDFGIIAVTNIGDANGGSVAFATTDAIIWTAIQKLLL
jgi:CubicO group peptidase (beta-lactamase class C family)